MSMFFCAKCNDISDSDDGAEELAGNLVCADCFAIFGEDNGGIDMHTQLDAEGDGCEAIDPSQPHPTTPEGK